IGGHAWRAEPPLPLPRTEVTAALAGHEILVAGGFLADGSSTARTDLYDPVRRAWRGGPDLPEAVNHAAAASLDGTAYVAGGYAAGGPTRTAAVLADDEWRLLPPLPAPRAGGAAAAGLAQRMLAYDPRRQRWSSLPGPTPRQHLAAAVLGGRIYAIAGRTAGADTNLRIVESWAPPERSWRGEPPLPEAWGGTGAATTGNTFVSAGGESP